MRKLSVIFGEILSRVYGHFETQNEVLESRVIIIIILLITIIYYYCYCKNNTGKVRTEWLKAFLRSLFRQPITSQRFWFEFSLSSFGISTFTHTHTHTHTHSHTHPRTHTHSRTRTHTHILHNIARLFGKKWDSRVPRQSSRVLRWARVP
jgi:hypothetical protein